MTFLLLALASLCALSWGASRRVASAEGWMTAERSLPSWAVAAAWISAEFSAMTMLGVPAAAYRGDWSLLQFFLGSALARIVVAFYCLRRLYGEGPDLYAFLEGRFGRATRLAASAFFAAARTLSSSVRLMAVAAIAASFFHSEDTRWVALFAAVAVFVAAAGGVRAAVWAGCLQAAAVAAGGLCVLSFLTVSFEGGIGEAVRVAENAGRLAVWNFNAPAAVLTGFFGSLAAFGTDGETMQRVFAARSRLSAQRAVIFAAAAAAVILIIYLAVGTGLFVFYEQRTALALPAAADAVLPHFSAQILTPQLKAVLLVSFVLASIDLPLVGLATVFPGPGGGGRTGLRRLRVGALVWGTVFALGAVLLARRPDWLWLGFKIGGVVYGPLLGVFAYGFLGKRRPDAAAAGALLISAALCGWALWAMETGSLALEWRWLPVLGSLAAAALTHGLSRLFGSPKSGRQ